MTDAANLLSPIAIIVFLTIFAVFAWRNLPFALAILFGLLPTYLIRFHLGPLPTTLLETMIWIILLAWFVKTFAACRLSPLIKQHLSLFTAIGLFLLAATISIFISVNTRAALGEWKAFYVEPIILFIIIITAIKTEKQINLILSFLIFSGLIISLLAIYQRFTGFLVPDAFWANRGTYRVTTWYGFPNAVGLFLAPLVPLAVYLIKTRKHEGTKAMTRTSSKARNAFTLSCFYAFVPTSILAIVFAKSLGPLIAVAVGIAVILILQKRWKWLATSAIIIVIALLASGSWPTIQQQLQIKVSSSSLRVNMWAETAEFLRARPLRGAGLASYQTLIYPYRIDKWIEVFHHPHNIFLTIWVNLGLLGLFAFVWIIVWFYRFGLSNKTLYPLPSTLYHYLIISMTIWLVTGLADSPYIKNDLALLFWLLPALLVVSKKTEKAAELLPKLPDGGIDHDLPDEPADAGYRKALRRRIFPPVKVFC